MKAHTFLDDFNLRVTQVKEGKRIKCKVICCSPLCERAAGTGAERAPCHCTVAAAGAGAERLSCRTIATAGADVKVSPAITSNNYSSKTAILGLDG